MAVIHVVLVPATGEQMATSWSAGAWVPGVGPEYLPDSGCRGWVDVGYRADDSVVSRCIAHYKSGVMIERRRILLFNHLPKGLQT